jgi:hypothetical protein
MAKTQKAQPSTDNGAKNGQPNMRLRLPDLPEYKLDVEGDLNAFDATDSEFLNFVQSLVPLTGENTDHWTWEERRDFLNWCLDEQVLTIQDGRLVPVEETMPTAPLTSDTDGDEPVYAEDIEVAHSVERAHAVITSDPTITANELAEIPGMQSEDDVQTVKDAVNAQQSAEKGDEACSHE